MAGGAKTRNRCGRGGGGREADARTKGGGKAEKWNGGDRGGGGGKVICASKGKLDLSLCSSVSVRPLIYIAPSPAAALLV